MIEPNQLTSLSNLIEAFYASMGGICSKLNQNSIVSSWLKQTTKIGFRQILWKSPSRKQAVIESPVSAKPIVRSFTFYELDRCRIQIWASASDASTHIIKKL